MIPRKLGLSIDFNILNRGKYPSAKAEQIDFVGYRFNIGNDSKRMWKQQQ
jgi:hypothetical protein